VFKNTFYAAQTVENDEILVYLSMQILAASRITLSQKTAVFRIVQTI